MQTRVYETVGRQSVCMSLRPPVCPIILQQQHAAGLLLSAMRAGDIDGELWAPGAQHGVQQHAYAGSVTLIAAGRG